MTKEILLTTGLITLTVLSLFCGAFGIGTTGGITEETAFPSSGWEVVTTGITWVVDALTFQASGMPAIIPVILWLFILVTIFVPVIEIVRGV